MSLSYVAYPADGVTTQFDLTFGYLSRSHVFVFVDDTLSSYRWITGTRLELGLAPDPGQTVKIQRLTDRVNRLTDFSDGQTLLAGDLDAADLQNFYILQELFDQVTDGVLTGSIPINEAGSSYVTEQWINSQLEINAYSTQAYITLLQQITDEEIARAQAIADEAQQRLDGLAAEAVARADAILAEANARAAALNILASDLTNEVTTRASQVAALGSDLADETTARVLGDDTLNAAIVAESTARQSDSTAFATTLTGIVTRQDNTDAAVLAETTARSTADDALSQLLTVLTTRVGDAEADIVSEQQARTTSDTAIASDVTLLTTRMGDAEADILSEQTARADGDAAIASDVSGLLTRMGDAEADIVSEQTARSSADAAIVSDVTALTTRMGDAEADIVSEQQARSTADAAITSDVTLLSTRMGDAEADILSEQTARSTADAAIATDLTALTTRMGDAEAGIVSEQTVRADADTALSNSITALLSQIGDAEAAIISEQQARATGDNALTSSLNALTSRVGDTEAGIVDNATAIASETSARASALSTLGARVDTTEADIVTVSQAIVDEGLARVDDIEAANAATATAQADATEALGLVADETSARSAAFNSLDARVTSSLANDADFIKNPSASYGTAVGYSGNRTGRNVGVTIATDSGVPSGAAFSRAGTDTYVHKPGYGVGTSDLGWYKEGGWGGTSIRIRGWFKSPSSTMVSEVGVHLCDINFLNPAWPRVAVSTATETDWVWFDDVYLISTSYTQEVLMPFIRCTGPDTPLVLFEQVSWVDVSTVQDLSDTVSTQAASIASAQQAIADESTARASALDTVNARFESNVNHRNIHPMPLFDDDWATVYTAGWDGNHGLTVNRGVNLDPTGAWGGKGGFDVHFTKITGTPASGTVVHDVGLKDDYLIPVVAGGVYFYSVFAAEHRLNQLVLLANRYDTSKTYITSNIIMNSATDLTKTAANGNAENFVRLWGYFTAPETGFASVYTRGIANGVDVDPYLWTAGYMVARVDTTHDTSKPLPFTSSEAAAAKSVAGVKFLKDAFATPNSSTARLLLGVNTANNEAVIEQVAQEGSGVWNGSKIKFTADDFEFNGDVIINGTITADNLAIGAVSNQEVSENSAALSMSTATWVDAATLTFDSVGIGVELRGSAVVSGSGFGGGPGTFKWRVLRGATVIKGPFDIPAIEEVTDLGAGVFQYSKTANFVADTNDVPSSGTHTYKLQVYLTGNGGTSPAQSVSQRYLSAREFKR